VFSPNIDALQVGQRLHARAESASKTRVNAFTTCASIEPLGKDRWIAGSGPATTTFGLASLSLKQHQSENGDDTLPLARE
jgi:hypothetical protein